MRSIEPRLIDKYLDSKSLAWANSTMKSERPRLNQILPLLNGNPETLWRGIMKQGAYSRVTTWTRATDFWQFLMHEGKVPGTSNPYKEWRVKYAKLFKNTYRRSKPTISFEDAKNRINSSMTGDERLLALQIIDSGMRFSESQNVVGFEVRGKGGKHREVYLPATQERPARRVRYETFRRRLAKIGLRPHDLRKLFLSRMVELGANEFDLCEVAGWETIAVASSYIKANNSRLRRLVKAVQGGTTDDETEHLPTVFQRK